jgi:hypothetical protein
MEDHDFNERDQSTLRDVFVHVSFTKIHDIDTINQRFQAELLIESRWLHENQSLKLNSDDLSSSKIEWTPEICIENAVNESKEEVSYKIYKDSKSQLIASEIRRVKGVFHENLELHNFPLDIQDLTICVSTKKTSRKVNLIPLNQPEHAKLNISHNLDKSAWHLHDMVRTKKA